MAEAEALMRGRQVDSIVRIPPTFSATGSGAEEQYSLSSMERMQRRPPVFVVMCPQPLMDGTSAADSAGRVSAAPGVELVDRLWFNSANSSTWYLVSGLIVLITDPGWRIP